MAKSYHAAKKAILGPAGLLAGHDMPGITIVMAEAGAPDPNQVTNPQLSFAPWPTAWSGTPARKLRSCASSRTPLTAHRTRTDHPGPRTKQGGPA